MSKLHEFHYFEQIGWHTEDGNVTITWDDVDSQSDTERDDREEESNPQSDEDPAFTEQRRVTEPMETLTHECFSMCAFA